MWKLRDGQEAWVEVAVEAGFDLDSRDAWGNTPLMRAVAHGRAWDSRVGASWRNKPRGPQLVVPCGHRTCIGKAQLVTGKGPNNDTIISNAMACG